jgi:cell division protein FtsN
MVSLGTVVAHRLRIELMPAPRSQAAQIAQARAAASETLSPASARTEAPRTPATTSAAPAISRNRVTVSARPAAPSTVVRPRPDDPPAPESQVAAPRAPRHALEVAAFIFLDRAESERERLVTEGLRARIVTEWENGAPTYRVMVGSYASRAAAERAADDLLGTGLVQQARIVTTPDDR